MNYDSRKAQTEEREKRKESLEGKFREVHSALGSDGKFPRNWSHIRDYFK